MLKVRIFRNDDEPFVAGKLPDVMVIGRIQPEKAGMARFGKCLRKVFRQQARPGSGRPRISWPTSMTRSSAVVRDLQQTRSTRECLRESTRGNPQ